MRGEIKDLKTWSCFFDLWQYSTKTGCYFSLEYYQDMVVHLKFALIPWYKIYFSLVDEILNYTIFFYKQLVYKQLNSILKNIKQLQF